MTTNWFSTEMNRMMASAESALHGRPTAARFSAASAKRDDGDGGFSGGTTRDVVPYRDPSAAAWFDSRPLSHAESFSELSRQLRVCMTELREVRQELALEREARSSVLTAFAKRIKEEVLGDVRSSEHHLLRSIRELEAEFSQRLTEQDSARALMKRTVDDAVRKMLAMDRGSFDVHEQVREELQEIRSKVDQTVAQNQLMRVEMAQRSEKDSAAQSHRLDLELQRYAELYRQQQQQLADTKRTVADEVAVVGKTVASLVEECWSRRLETVHRTVTDSLEGFRKQHDRHAQSVADVTARMTQFSRDIRSEVQLSTTDLRDRLVAVEGQLPLLTARVDRFERKADSVFEAANRVTAQMDSAQETCDRVAVLVAKNADRMQRVEDIMIGRDDRLLRCETQLTALAGLDRVTADIEGLRRTLTRVEGMMDAVKQTADRDERLVEAMQSSIDSSLERADAVEKKAQKVVARVETAEQRLMGFVDRILSLEDASEKLHAAVGQAANSHESTTQRLVVVENRVRAVQDKHEANWKELADRLQANEERNASSTDSAARWDSVQSQLKKEMERLDKRIQRFEAGSSNTVDNLREIHDMVDLLQKECQGLAKKVEQQRELLDRKASVLDAKLMEFDAAGVSLTERFARNDKRTVTLLDGLEKRVDERIDVLARRVEDVQTAAARRATQEMVGASSSRSLSGPSIVDETMAAEIRTARQRIDGVEARLRQLESKASVAEEDIVRRYELQAVRSAVSASEQSLRLSLERLQQSLVAVQSYHQTSARAATMTAASAPPVSVAPVRDADAAATTMRGTGGVPATAAVDDHRRDGSPTARRQKSSSPASADGGVEPFSFSSPERDSAGATGAAVERLSSVSSMHGAVVDIHNDGNGSVLSVESSSGAAPPAAPPLARLSTTTAAAPSLPPLAGGGSRAAAVGVATSIPSADLAAVKKRSPYSDTSESDADRGGVFQRAVQSQLPSAAASGRQQTTAGPTRSPEATAAATAVAPSEETSKVAAMKKKPGGTIVDDFDDDDDDDEFELTEENTLREPPPVPLSAASMYLAPPRTEAPTELKAEQPRSPLGGEAITTDDDVPAFLAASNNQRRLAARGGFASTGDTSSAADLSAPPPASRLGGSGSADAQPKKFHATVRRTSTSGGTAARDFDVDDDDDDDDDNSGDRKPPSASSPKDADSLPRSRGSRRSGQSRRTTDVSLSLGSSRRNTQSSRRRAEEALEEIEDDDKLAEMLGFMSAKKK